SGSEINLNGWIIKDESNKSFKISELILNSNANTRIFPTTISLNNDGDTINLYDPQNKLIDSYKYGKVTKDQVVSVNDENQISEDEENIVDERILIDVPEVRSINTESDIKSIYEILKKPIFYKVEDYIGI
ncbi:MAG TPA: lamin tail domain-containing protein, partial [Candidatus Dojkabacteria bacterium]|nr:lamin tail domain-containing protein [Candidatus Dojkabacteria bacterium]